MGGFVLATGASATAATNLDQTIKNLNAAYQGESNAHHRYALFANKAEEEGYPQVAKLFRATSRAEQIHRDTHRQTIEKLGGNVEEFTLDEVTVSSTADNLKIAIEGESYERDTMYPGFMSKAKQDGSRDAVRTFRFALEAEKEHAKLYTEALSNLGNNSEADYYVCTVCGNTVTVLPNKKCPVCRNKLDKYELVN